MENDFDDFDTQIQIEDVDSYDEGDRGYNQLINELIDEEYFHVAPEPPEEPEWCDRCGSYHPAQRDCFW
jgi:hypothetical protein